MQVKIGIPFIRVKDNSLLKEGTIVADFTEDELSQYDGLYTAEAKAKAEEDKEAKAKADKKTK